MNFIVVFILVLMIPQFVPQSENTVFSITFSDWYGYIHLLSLRLLVCMSLLKLIKTIPGKKVKQISLLTCLFVFVLMEAITGSIDPFIDYNLYNILYIVSGSGIAILYLVTFFKKYAFKSDFITDNNIFLCFYRPVTLKMFLSSLLGFPFGGMCIYTNQTKYGFIIKKNTFKAEKISAVAIQRKFIVIDTGILYSDAIGYKLNGLIGTKAGKRINCIWTLKPVLNMLGNKFAPRWWELIPPTYSMKVL